MANSIFFFFFLKKRAEISLVCSRFGCRKRGIGQTQRCGSPQGNKSSPKRVSRCWFLVRVARIWAFFPQIQQERRCVAAGGPKLRGQDTQNRYKITQNRNYRPLVADGPATPHPPPKIIHVGAEKGGKKTPKKPFFCFSF